MACLDNNTPRGLKIANVLIVSAAILLLGSALCSRNNPLDPKAGNYNAGTNLLRDPSFENGDTASWRMAISGGRAIVDTVSAQNGTFCEQMTLHFPFPRTVWQIVPVSAGKVYSVSGWIKTDGVTTSAHILVLWYNTTPPINQMPTGFIKADTLGSLRGTNAWTRLSSNYYAPSAALTAQLFLECVPDTIIGNGTAWFDDLTFNAH